MSCFSTVTSSSHTAWKEASLRSLCLSASLPLCLFFPPHTSFVFSPLSNPSLDSECSASYIFVIFVSCLVFAVPLICFCLISLPLGLPSTISPPNIAPLHLQLCLN